MAAKESMKHEEGKETPQQEASYHQPGFLKKAAKLATKKMGKRGGK